MNTSTRRTGPLLLLGLLLAITFCGSATAAHLITGTQVKDGSITGKDLRDAGTSGLDVQDRSITAADLDRVPQAPPGLPGAAGSSGPSGAPGVSGPPGIPGFGAVVVVKGAKVYVDNEEGHRQTAYCPEGTRVLSGGITVDSTHVITRESRPLDGGVGWTVNFYTANNTWGFARPYAVCARA